MSKLIVTTSDGVATAVLDNPPANILTIERYQRSQCVGFFAQG